MRICIIGPHLLPGSASAIQRTMMMAEGLSEIPEVTVHVIIPRFTSDNERIRSSSVKVEHLYNQNCKSTQIISKKGRWISRFILLQTVVRMNFNCRYDWLMYYSGVSPESLLYALLSKVLGLNYCSHLADPLPIGSNYIHKFKYHAKLSLWKCVLSLSRCVIVISKGMVDIVDELSVNVKVVLIPIMVPSNEMYTNQVDSCSSKTPCPGTLSTVVYSGKMTRSSGVLDLLDAISISNGQWVLAISGPLKEFSSRHIDIQYEISKRGLSNEVFYLGYLSKCDYKRLISSADVLVVPKTDEAINVGNMPGKLAEFLMAGRPVVAANIGDISMYVRDCEDVLLYDAGDISDLESKISLFLKDHEFSHKVGFSGRRAAILSFGNVKLMERLYSFLNKL